MNKRTILLLLALLFSIAMLFSACGGTKDVAETDTEATDNGTEDETDDENETEEADEGTADFSAAMVTDVGGVDDKSFNQSAWEGLQMWGEEHGLEEKEGYDYAQSEDESDYLPNLTRLVRNDFDVIFGIGFMLEDGISTIAEQYPDNNFAIVDSVVESENVASITFADYESSFLVGVAAAMKTKTDKVGFVGGVESDIITAFDVGFAAGVKSINPDIEIDVRYAGAFDAPDEGKLIASSMYDSGADIVFHASGATGNGVFAQAKDLKNSDPDREIWVIGVDRDQHEDGQIGDHNVTLTSALKRVDNSVIQVSNLAMEGNFPGGEILEFNLADEGVGYADTNKAALTDDIIEALEEWKEKIIDGEIDVPSTDAELEEFLKAL